MWSSDMIQIRIKGYYKGNAKSDVNKTTCYYSAMME